MGIVAQHAISTFSSPVNATSPIDANTVRGNDNTIKTAYNAHDADTTIHLQNGAISSRPSASTAGQMWLATDTGAVVGSYDTGSVWVSWNYVATDTNGSAVITSSQANAFDVGPNGATNPTLQVDCSTASAATGLKLKSAAAGGGFALSVISSGTDENLTINAKGAGTIGIGSVSTGRVTITPVTTITGALTLSAALTYGGVTLSNAVTGTGNMVLSAGPTFTGTITAAIANFSGLVTASAGVLVNGGTVAAGRIVKDAASGLTLAAVTGSSYDFAIVNAANSNYPLLVPTGTNNVVFAGAVSGITTLASGAITVTPTTVSGLSVNRAATADVTVNFGDDTTTAANNLAGWQFERYSDGSLYTAMKTFTGGMIYFRSGAGAEVGYARTWMTVNPTTSAIAFAGAVSGVTSLAMGGALSGVTTLVASSSVTAASLVSTADLDIATTAKFGTGNGRVSSKSSLSLANGGTSDLTVDAGTGASFTGILVVANADAANSGNRTQIVYVVNGRGSTTITYTTLSTVTTGTGYTFTLATAPPSSGVVRLTNSGGGACNAYMQFFGGTGA